MPVKSSNVFVGAPDQSVTAAILSGPETDTIPQTIDDFTWTGLKEAGYASEDGVTLTPSESTESIRDWSLKTIRKVLTEFDATMAWTHLELNQVSAENYFGEDNVDVTAATTAHGTQLRMALAGEMRETKAWYFKVKDGDRRVVVFVPHGQVSERGEVAIVASGAISLPVTLSTYPDAAGKSVYVYTDDGVLAAA
ncbi:MULTISPECIES: hypothetical protein [unclassified Microbacterium]|uniref:phage tail tube protein n=1 Tax=Microbacterium TaxID=33882 RepID=UPI003BA18FF6